MPVGARTAPAGPTQLETSGSGHYSWNPYATGARLRKGLADA